MEENNKLRFEYKRSGKHLCGYLADKNGNIVDICCVSNDRSDVGSLFYKLYEREKRRKEFFDSL